VTCALLERVQLHRKGITTECLYILPGGGPKFCLTAKGTGKPIRGVFVLAHVQGRRLTSSKNRAIG
jgi:hypothetical protein